ncbi:MAG: GAF domain-containing protein, partial [Terriglobia bacterium]
MDETLKDNLAAEAAGEARPGERTGACGEQDVLACLSAMVEDISSTLDVQALMRQVGERVREFIHYDTFAIHLLDPLGQELRIAFGIGYSEQVIQHWRLGLGQGLAGTAAQTGKPVRVGDVTRDPRYVNAFEEIASEMCIPLIVKGRTIGVLDVGSRQRDAFSEDHERMLTFLAGHLANAIENARLYENLRAQTHTLS